LPYGTVAIAFFVAQISSSRFRSFVALAQLRTVTNKGHKDKIDRAQSISLFKNHHRVTLVPTTYVAIWTNFFDTVASTFNNARFPIRRKHFYRWSCLLKLPVNFAAGAR